jgi:hypothetical protein
MDGKQGITLQRYLGKAENIAAAMDGPRRCPSAPPRHINFEVLAAAWEMRRPGTLTAR